MKEIQAPIDIPRPMPKSGEENEEDNSCTGKIGEAGEESRNTKREEIPA